MLHLGAGSSILSTSLTSTVTHVVAMRASIRSPKTASMPIAAIDHPSDKSKIGSDESVWLLARTKGVIKRKNPVEEVVICN